MRNRKACCVNNARRCANRHDFCLAIWYLLCSNSVSSSTNTASVERFTHRLNVPGDGCCDTHPQRIVPTSLKKSAFRISLALEVFRRAAQLHRCPAGGQPTTLTLGACCFESHVRSLVGLHGSPSSKKKMVLVTAYGWGERFRHVASWLGLPKSFTSSVYRKPLSAPCPNSHDCAGTWIVTFAL